jgi:hypothetical protein
VDIKQAVDLNSLAHICNEFIDKSEANLLNEILEKEDWQKKVSSFIFQANSGSPKSASVRDVTKIPENA